MDNNGIINELYFASGCFWGAEKFFRMIEGVTATEVGYANGNTSNPTYRLVYTDTTGYAETVHVSYDPALVSAGDLTRLFLKIIDPLSLNKQGEDEGTRYRTGVYYTSEDVVPAIKEAFDEKEKELGQSLAVELLPLKNFYRAEDEHQLYLEKNPTGYCHLTPGAFRIAKEFKKR